MNKILIVTGGSSGLGKELVKEGINRGYFVCNLSRNQEKMNELDNLYKENYCGFVGDISDENFVKDAIKKIASLGEITCLINAAQKATFKDVTLYDAADIDLSLAGLKVFSPPFPLRQNI